MKTSRFKLSSRSKRQMGGMSHKTSRSFAFITRVIAQNGGQQIIFLFWVNALFIFLIN